MIKKLSSGFLLVLSAIAIQAQGIYSQENLEKASPEDLYPYLTKAQKMKKTGGTLLIVAPVSVTLGVLLWTDAWKGGSELHRGGELNNGVGLFNCGPH